MGVVGLINHNFASFSFFIHLTYTYHPATMHVSTTSAMI